jgi:glutathione S-transferase
MSYTLYYWPGIQGRGEFVRLALEEAGVPYVDAALMPQSKGGGASAVVKILKDKRIARPPFAPPILKVGRQFIAQTPNILLFLGDRLKLAPRDEAGKLWTHQLQLTISDFYLEAFHTHHPLGDGYSYEEQKGAAKRSTKDFLSVRLPKFFDYFQRVLERNRARGPWMVGARLTYADLSMAHMIAGLRYAFPTASAKALRTRARLRTLHDQVFERPRIALYAASDRRHAFSNEDLFRYYPELDR